MIVNPGIRRFLGSAIQRLFNSASFYAPLTHTLALERGTGSPTFTRASTATVTNNDGYLVTALAGEARFVGARRVRNLLTATEAFDTAAWGKSNATMTANQIAAPDGTTTADLFTATANAQQTVWFAAGIAGVYSTVYSAYVKAGTATWLNFTLWDGAGVLGAGIQVWFNLTTGAVGNTVVGAGFALSGTSSTFVGNGWYRISIAGTASGGSFLPAFRITDSNGVNVTTATSGKTFYIWGAQLEDVTAQTTQTAGEYVSVGVESAPYYHGSMVDGVKCFPTDLSGNPLPTAYTYDAVSLNGVAGTYVSTPDSVAASITGDIELYFDGTAVDWTPTSDQILIGKDSASNPNRDILLFLRAATSRLELWTSGTGSSYAGRTASATVALPFANLSRGQIKATRSAATGATNFSTSTDQGATWTPLGDSDIATTAGAIHDGTSVVSIGSLGDGTTAFAGKIYQAQIYNGINGTLAVDFDASRYAGGTTLTGSTGETWTLQGNAVIHPTNSPMLGYQAQGTRTNLQTYSNTAASWAGANATVAATTGPDGASSAIRVTGDATVGIHLGYAPVVAKAASAIQYTGSFLAKAGSSNYLSVYLGDGSGSGAVGTFNLALGTVSTAATGTGGSAFTSVSGGISSFGNGWYLVFVTATSNTAATLYLFAGLSNDGSNVPSFNATGAYVDVAGSQIEQGVSFPSSRIATTTIAVARNADVLTYSSAGNIDGTKGWAYAEVTTEWASGTSVYNAVIGSYTSSVGPLIGQGNAPTEIRLRDGTNSVSSPAFTSMATGSRKVASTWGGSDAKVTASGLTPTSGSFDGDMGFTNIPVGCTALSDAQWYGTIRNVRIGQRQLSASEMQAITA